MSVNALCRLEARAELMRTRLATLNEENDVIRELMVISTGRQTRMEELVLEGEQALNFLVVSIGKRKRNE